LKVLYAVGKTNREEKKRHKVSRLDKVLLIKVTLPLFDKYIIMHSANRCSIFSIMSSNIDLALNEALNRRPRYFIGKDLATQDASLTFNIIDIAKETNSDLVKLILKLETASKHKNKQQKL
jgi:hypothetical protein